MQNKESKQPDVQVKHNMKDSVFTHLFRERKYLFQLYQCLHPEDVETTAQDIEDVTTENVIINGIYNDLGFRVRDRQLILIEAQSTWTENILIRALEYMVHAIRQYLEEQEADLYGTAKVKLPIPELYVVYSGTRQERPKYLTLKDSFFGGKETALDVKIQMLYGQDENSILGQYVKFAKTYDAQYQLLKDREKAILETIRICKQQNVLKEYLESKETEVHDMMFGLYDEATLRKIHDNAIWKAARDEGRNEGRSEGRKEGRSQGRNEGIRNLISSCREFNIDDAAIQQKVISKYNLTPELARSYMQQA